VQEGGGFRAILDPIPLILPIEDQVSKGGQVKVQQLGDYEVVLLRAGNSDVVLVESRSLPDSNVGRTVRSNILYSFKDGVLAVRLTVQEIEGLVEISTFYNCGKKALFASLL
jgi:hypothetical protein